MAIKRTKRRSPSPGRTKSGPAPDRTRSGPAPEGSYTITAADLLLSLGLRQQLKDDVVSLKSWLDEMLRKYNMTPEDKEKLKDRLEQLEGVTEPIAFGFTRP